MTKTQAEFFKNSVGRLHLKSVTKTPNNKELIIWNPNTQNTKSKFMAVHSHTFCFGKQGNLDKTQAKFLKNSSFYLQNSRFSHKTQDFLHKTQFHDFLFSRWEPTKCRKKKAWIRKSARYFLCYKRDFYWALMQMCCLLAALKIFIRSYSVGPFFFYQN